MLFAKSLTVLSIVVVRESKQNEFKVCFNCYLEDGIRSGTYWLLWRGLPRCDLLYM